ncbi:MAG: SUMF1/EgtB/PvdO family nonheme iron enzyme [Candidatus Lernaella stagnicola]|nr:SUMF1/EgtB/PvdO family nonheme iron enzyme [Candidatus Lernaella stagnicola]
MFRHVFGLVLALLVGGVVACSETSPSAGMVSIPAGAFDQGCVPAQATTCPDNAGPRRRVELDAFFLDVHEVTVAAYKECVDAGACRAPANKKPAGIDEKWARYDFAYTWDRWFRNNHPINGVTWDDAAGYCRWRGKRLPTEAEFEKALRGGSPDNIFPWGDDAAPSPGFGNYADDTAHKKFHFWRVFQGYDDGYVGTSPVCSFEKNAYGLCDIAGNLWEWCADAYEADWYARMPAKNPLNEANVGLRVVRGGGFRGTPSSATASHRVGLPRNEYVSSRGFRCAKNATAP